MATKYAWFNIIPHSEWDESSPTGVLAIELPVGSAAYNTINSDLNGTGFLYNGKEYDLWNGPFSSENDAATNARGASTWEYVGVIAGTSIGSAIGAPAGNPGLAGIGASAGGVAGNAAGSTFDAIEDLVNFFKSGSLWTRVGETLAGFLLLYIGLKAAVTPSGQQPARRTIKDTAKTVAKVIK